MFQPRSCGTITLWPWLEIGKSSAKPWSNPSRIAWPYEIGPLRKITGESVGEGPATVLSTAGGVCLVRSVDGLEFLQRSPRPDRHTGQRRLGQVYRHLRLGAQPLRQPLQERAAASQHDAPVHDVGRQLGRRLVQ